MSRLKKSVMKMSKKSELIFYLKRLFFENLRRIKYNLLFISFSRNFVQYFLHIKKVLHPQSERAQAIEARNLVKYLFSTIKYWYAKYFSGSKNSFRFKKKAPVGKKFSFFY